MQAIHSTVQFYSEQVCGLVRLAAQIVFYANKRNSEDFFSPGNRHAALALVSDKIISRPRHCLVPILGQRLEVQML